MAVENVVTIRGLLLHDPRFGAAYADSTHTTATQAGGTPDQPERTGRGYADLDAVGWAAPSAGYSALTVTVAKEGGFSPGPGAGRVTWTDTQAHGHWPHKVITGFSWLKYESATATYFQPHAVQLEDGSVLAAYIRILSGAYSIRAVRRTLEDTSWGSEVDVGASSQLLYDVTNYRCGPSLVALPGGRVVCLYVDRVVSSGVVCLSMSYSDDKGATWSAGAIACAGTVLSSGAIGIRKFRAVYHNGYITAIITTTAANYHFVSNDLGVSFVLVANSQIGYGVELLPFVGANPMAVYADASAASLRFARKAGAFSDYVTDPTYGTILESNGAVASNVDTTTSSTAHVASCIAQDGTAYVAYRRAYNAVPTPGSRVSLIRIPANINTDAAVGGFHPGLLWETGTGLDTADADLFGCGDDVERMTDLCIVPYRGHLLMLHGVDATSGKTGSIGCVEMGGWSTLTWGRTTFAEYDDSTRFGRSYLPYTTATNVAGWTTVGASVIESLVSTGMQLSTAGAANRCWSLDGAGSYATPIVAFVRVNVTAGGSLTDNSAAVSLRWSDGAGDLKVTLRLTTTAARLRDENGAANLGTDATGLASEMRDWLIYMDGTNCRVWYRTPMGTDWTKTHDVTPTNNGATANVVHKVVWGDINGGTAVTSIWAFVGASLEDGQVADFSGGVGSLRGREVSLLPVYMQGGIAVRGRGGPFYRGNTYSIPVRYDYPLDALDPAVDGSPRRGWRASATTACTINWDMGKQSALLSPVIGCTLVRPLAQTVYFEASTDAATWVTLSTIALDSGLSGLTGSVSGDWLIAGAGTAAGTRTVAADELVGGWAILSSGGTTYVRKIAANSEGFWFDPATTAGRKLEIRLEGDVSTLPASPTVSIVPPMVTSVVWSVTASYRYWRLRFASLAQDALSPGYLALGKAIIGPVAVFGRQYSRGRVLSLEQNNRMSERPDGARRSNQVGPSRRVVEFQWTVPTDSTDLFDGANPDYVVAVSGGAVPALRQDLMVVEGILRRQKGSEIPVVYLPSVKYGSGSTKLYNAEHHVYGRITSEVVSRTNVLGNEASTEASTRGAVRIEEEV